MFQLLVVQAHSQEFQRTWIGLIQKSKNVLFKVSNRKYQNIANIENVSLLSFDIRTYQQKRNYITFIGNYAQSSLFECTWWSINHYFQWKPKMRKTIVSCSTDERLYNTFAIHSIFKLPSYLLITIALTRTF